MPPDIELRLPPEQVDCKWWMRGYCARGKTCYFKHDDAMFSAHNKNAQPRTATDTSSNVPASSVEHPAIPTSSTASSQTCAICFETPENYGLLMNCDHAFCLECVRNWRASAPTNPKSENELKKTSKTCPMCRSHSDFIIPSSIFPPPSTPNNNMKKQIVDGYLARLKTIPCRYFSQSIKDSVSTTEYKFKCQFGNSCHYAHTHPMTKQPYVFSQDELRRNRPKQPRRRDRISRLQFMDEMAIMEMLFSDLAVGEEWVDEHDLDAEDDFGDAGLAFERDYLSGLSSGEFDVDLDLDFDDDFGYDWAWE